MITGFSYAEVKALFYERAAEADFVRRSPLRRAKAGMKGIH
jgi:hypothetical protein